MTSSRLLSIDIEALLAKQLFKCARKEKGLSSLSLFSLSCEKEEEAPQRR